MGKFFVDELEQFRVGQNTNNSLPSELVTQILGGFCRARNQPIVSFIAVPPGPKSTFLPAQR